jgi:hypothetical protein
MWGWVVRSLSYSTFQCMICRYLPCFSIVCPGRSKVIPFWNKINLITFELLRTGKPEFYVFPISARSLMHNSQPSHIFE